MSKIKAVIFDFDGVIKESVDVKTQAFADMYKKYGKKIVVRVVEHHKKHGGVSRFKKFKVYQEEFLGRSVSPEEINSLAEQFSSIVLDKVVSAPFVAGAEDFIKNNYNKYDLFISSGTPCEEIVEIADRCGISRYFKGIYGSPELKGIHVKNILKDNAYRNEEVVFIGDAPSDKKAAQENNIFYIARSYGDNKAELNEKYVVCDLRSLGEIIKKINDNN